MPDALQLLREDHQKVKDLFKRFEESDDKREKQAICDETMLELVVHSTMEEEIFYPAVRAEHKSKEDGEMMDEADEEHHVVDLLIAELGSMKSSDSHFDAKYTVLAENVKHHIQEEESEMLPKAAELGSARMASLGDEMYARKMELMREMQSGDSRSSNGRSRNGSSANGRTATGRATRGAAGPKTAARKTAKTAVRKTTARKTTARKTTSRNGSSESRRTTRTGARKSAAGRTLAGASSRKTATRKSAARKTTARATTRTAAARTATTRRKATTRRAR